MTQRVKKSVFDTIQAYLPNSRVLDLFAGSGSLSFESLSRGAVSCHTVEKNKLCGNLIAKKSKNIKNHSTPAKALQARCLLFFKKI